MKRTNLRRSGGESRASGSPRRRAARLAAAAVLAAALALPTSPRAGCDAPIDTTILPLPVYATLPNEGSTWGAMPVFLRVCPTTKRTESIVAPSLSWNDVIQFTGTFRLFHYPTDDESLTVIASASTRINYNGLVVWQRVPTEPGASTDELTFRLQRSAFYRYFGLGPDTPAAAEASYTGFRAFAVARRGVNLASHLNLGVLLGVERDDVQDIAVPGLPHARQVFPGDPGMRGATTLSQGVEVRYDDRPGADYARYGFRLDAGAAVVEGLQGSPTFLRGAVQARGVFPELPRVTGAARVAWTGVSSGRAPFYRQSTLGGAFLLRGFTEDRFIDRQAWTVELEQRVKLLETHIFGVVADWRVDPFIAAGQVFGAFADAFSRPQVAVGAGFRAFVHPNVLGRIDVAAAGEGVKVYVELGYPY